MSEVNTYLLPGALRDLVRVLGEADAFRLVERRGGTRLILPKRVTPEHAYVDELGLRVFAALVDAYGSEVIELPKYDSVARQLRHERVRQLRKQGRTHDQIAMATGYSRRQVINILGDVAPEDRQLDMFELFGLGAAEQAERCQVVANDPFGLARR